LRSSRRSWVRDCPPSCVIAAYIWSLQETPPAERPQLFIKKLHQCAVLFDFNDANAELKGKQIKTQTLHEMLEYITTQRGVITDNIYPEVVKMVSSSHVQSQEPSRYIAPILLTSLQQTSFVRYPRLSTRLATPMIRKRMSLSSNLLGHI
jgi:hypothetical protein